MLGADEVGDADCGADVTTAAGAGDTGAVVDGADVDGADVTGEDVVVGPGVNDVGACTIVSPASGQIGSACCDVQMENCELRIGVHTQGVTHQ